MMDHKASVREHVFVNLRKVAFPDSRFHFDFGEFITDFEGSDRACRRLVEHEAYQSSSTIFITPDNCLEQLRYQALIDGKRILTTSYSIKRGFWLLEPDRIRPDRYLYASTLDGMEREARPMTLENIASELRSVDYLVTGTGAINEEGVRFGKGHGFFDAEWGMLFRIRAVAEATPVAAVVHDCQVLQEKLYPEIFDTVADLIFTPERTIVVHEPHKPVCGIVWNLLDPHMFETIPPLQELKVMEEDGVA
jgi:5-formyltetrahydrofolate cyclo-ligase